MVAPRFDNVLSMGNIIQIIAFIVAFAVAWGTTYQRLETVETTQKSIIQNGLDREARIRAMEIGASRSDERIENLLRSMDELKREQRETNQLLRNISRGSE